MMRKCPKCGSRRVAPIQYGMPAHSEEMERQLKDEKLYLGGCCVSGMQPTYHCFECKKDVGTPPILLSKYGEEDYRDIVTSIYPKNTSKVEPQLRIELFSLKTAKNR